MMVQVPIHVYYIQFRHAVDSHWYRSQGEYVNAIRNIDHFSLAPTEQAVASDWWSAKYIKLIINGNTIRILMDS